MGLQFDTDLDNVVDFCEETGLLAIQLHLDQFLYECGNKKLLYLFIVSF
jgi:hypothetical protein